MKKTIINIKLVRTSEANYETITDVDVDREEKEEIKEANNTNIKLVATKSTTLNRI